MKKKIALVLAIFYMVSMSGFAFGMHYCGGRLASISFFNTAPDCKMCSKMAELKHKNTCCKDTKIEVKVKDNHQVAANLTLQNVFGTTIAGQPFIFTTADLYPAATTAYNLNKAPPDLGLPSLNILNCTFRI